MNPATTTPVPTTPATAAPNPGPGPGDGLREIIEAYHAVTERLQQSHETLQNEVLRLRDQLASADAQLQRSKRLAALGEMAAGIAHEVRNPLAAIGLYAEMIQQDAQQWATLQPHAQPAPHIAPHIEQTATKINDAVRGLSGIVTDVLHFAQRLETRSQQLDPRELLERAVDAHRPVLDAEHIAINLNVAPDATLHADPALLHQALLNLIRNAADAMNRGDNDSPSKTRQIDISVQPDPKAATTQITLTDRGPGIAQDAADRIFNPFFTTRSTGTGLGLAIVHRIVDAHAGSITVHNHPTHGGAVFTLHLPQDPTP